MSVGLVYFDGGASLCLQKFWPGPEGERYT